MKLFFLSLTAFVLTQRIIELAIARRNAAWMKARGAVEFGAGHYPLIVLVHILFFSGTVTEVLVLDRPQPVWWPLPFAVFAAAQVLRVWCLFSLGRFWNTRIIVLPHASVVRRGPYRFMRHPNYIVVMLEFISFPLIFQAYITAVTVSLLNFAVLRLKRIPTEEQALSAVTNYAEEMGETARFLPGNLSKNRL